MTERKLPGLVMEVRSDIIPFPVASIRYVHVHVHG